MTKLINQRHTHTHTHRFVPSNCRTAEAQLLRQVLAQTCHVILEQRAISRQIYRGIVLEIPVSVGDATTFVFIPGKVFIGLRGLCG